MKIKNVGKVLLLSGMVLAGVGGTATYLTSLDEAPTEMKKVAQMSESQQQAFLDELLMKVSEGGKPSDIEALLVENIEGLNKDNASEAVYLLMTSLSVEQGDQMEKYRVLGDSVLQAYNENQFKAGRHETYKKVEDKSVQGYLDELKRQYLYIEDDGEGLYLSQDLKQIKENFKEYLNPAIQAVFEVRLLNQEDPYADANLTAFNMEKMMERILFIEGERHNWQETIYQGEMLALQEQAYVDFFGVTHDAYFELVNDKEVMKEEVREQMYLLQAEYANSFMGKEIIGFMDELEADGFERKDTQSFVYEQANLRFMVESDVQSPIILNGTGGDAE